MNDYSLEKLQNDLEKYSFMDTYKSIYYNTINDLDESSHIKLLELAISLMNSKSEQLFDLGYYIIVCYSIETGDYIPLFEISEKMLNFPIINFLYKKELIITENTFFTEIDNSVMQLLKVKNDYYYTANQKYMDYKFFQNDCNISVIAPTSFGKTDLIKKYVKENYNQKFICILEPTKAMLNQIRNDILIELSNDAEKPKIVTHYDMNFNNKEKIILVMTQERLFKLIYDRKKNIQIDTLLVDEAHNIFDKDSRSFLLAKIIYLLKNKNPNIIVKYFSPIINDSSNLKIKNDIDEELSQLKINPKMKIEKYYYVDFYEKKKYIYDQFFNDFYCCGELKNIDKYEFIIQNASHKNLLYINRPKQIKEEIKKMERFLPEKSNDNIDTICNTLKEYINKDYDLIDYLKKGIVYHFGAMPDNVRNYVEKCVKEEDNLKYIFCTSTLLEGVNMPFDKLFILDLKKGRGNLTYNHLKNLIGRINRYNNIFDLKNNDLNGLISNIFFIKEISKDSNYCEFIKDNIKVNCHSKKRQDIVKNSLLKNSTEELNQSEKDIIENLKELNQNENYRKIKTEVGKSMIELNIDDFDVFEYEEIINERINNDIIKTSDSIIEKIYKIFIDGINITSDNELLLKRLENKSARDFYDMIINWRKDNLSLNESVMRFVNYWNSLSIEQKKIVFVGKSFGEIKRNESDRIPMYVDLNLKSRKEMINLAIIRIKEENDYIEYNLFKYIDFLYKYNLIEENDYNLLHYGTIDAAQIFFQREGLSRELAKVLTTKYEEYIFKIFDDYSIENDILNVFNDNDVLKYELQNYLKE